MGSSYSAPSPQPMADVLQAYQQYLPQIVGVTAAQEPGAALNQLESTALTAPGYNALNLDQAQQYALPLAQVGQQVTQSNALAGAGTNLAQLQGPGGQAAQAALGVAQASNPNYYQVQNPLSSQAANLLGAINLGGLSPGEEAATERSLNQNNVGTGNLGLLNPTNTISNAMNFGGAFNNKLGILGNAINSATGAATSAQNTGFSPVNIALGQPNTSTMGNFGTGTFAPTNAGTQGQNASNVFNFGSGMLGNQTSANNAMTNTAGTFAQAQAQAMSGLANSIGGCCFIYLEATNGYMPDFVRLCRDRYYKRFPQIATGYKRMAKWLVPLMHQHTIIKYIVWHQMVKPLTLYGGFIRRRAGYSHGRNYRLYRRFWFTVWNFLGKA
jgi:hypothetical protein